MKHKILRYQKGVTLVGGGPVASRDLAAALKHAPHAIAADSGGDRLLNLGILPEAVIGDLDSLSEAARAALPDDRLIAVTEQAWTDFDKCLRVIEAPFFLCLGFAGGRSDHALAVMNALIRHHQSRALVIGGKDIYFAAPEGEMRLRLRKGDRLSLFPFAAVTGKSLGLEWEIEGLNFAPDGFIGTSNRVREPEVTLSFAQRGMLVILPRARLGAAIAALTTQAAG